MERAQRDEEIDVRTLEKRLEDDGGDLFLLDVREPWEWEVANLGDRGARLIPMGEIPERLEEIPEDGDIVVYCRSGGRSGRVVSFLRERGYDGALNLDGGILAWAAEIDPSLETY